MLGFLDEIEQTPDPGAISVYIPPGFSAPEIEDSLQKGKARAVPDELSQLASSSKTGAVLFCGDMRKCLVLPPFPLSEKTTFGGYVTEPFRLLLTTDFMIGRHKKGGSSQQRFQRHRENQVREFLDRVCLHIREQLEPHAQTVNYIAYGGPRQTVLLLQKRCPFLQSFEDRVLPLLDVPSLGQRVLETAMGRIWSSCIIDWQEE